MSVSEVIPVRTRKDQQWVTEQENAHVTIEKYRLYIGDDDDNTMRKINIRRENYFTGREVLNYGNGICLKG